MKARHALVWFALCFMTMQFLGGLFLDYGCSEARFPSAHYLLHALHARPAAPDVVGLGSSRLGLALHAGEAGALLREHCPGARPITVFNAAVTVGGLVTSDFMLQRLSAEGIRPRVLVIEISPELVSDYNEWLEYDLARHLTWSDLPTYFADILRARLLRPVIVERLFPLCAHRPRLLPCAQRLLGGDADVTETPEGLSSNQTGLDSQGLFGATLHKLGQLPGDCRTEWGTALQQPRRWLRNYRLGGTAQQALQRLLERCQANGIQVILVRVPMRSDYGGLYTSAVEESFATYMNELTRTHACRFVDHARLVPDQLFLDNSHLLPEGAVRFTRTLTREVLVNAVYGLTEAVKPTAATVDITSP